VWTTAVISLGLLVSGVWQADAKYNQAPQLAALENHAQQNFLTLSEDVRLNSMAIQMHARDDMAIRVIELESQEIITEPEREKILFYRDRMERIDRLIMRLNK